MAQHRLLVVDDEATTRTTLVEYFESVGYDVDAAQDAREAIERLSAEHQLVLTDIVMPGPSGIDLLKTIRAKNPKIGIFLLTAHPAMDTLNAAKQYGAVAYFRKPPQLPEIDARMRDFLGEGTAAGGPLILVVGQALRERLADRVPQYPTVVCSDEEPAFLQAVKTHRPVLVVANATAAETPELLRVFQQLGRTTESFLLAFDETGFDAASNLLFGAGANGCLSLDASKDELQRAIGAAIKRQEIQKRNEENSVGAESSRCTFAKEYRHGYYCVTPRRCPYGPYQGGWIAIEKSQYHQCLKRPLLMDSLLDVAFVGPGHLGKSGRAADLREKILALAQNGKREIVLDAYEMGSASFTLFEMISDIVQQLDEAGLHTTLTVINLPESARKECQDRLTHERVRWFGARMIDEKKRFARWGTRFD
jgi:CheY-like chemotaxis protein